MEESIMFCLPPVANGLAALERSMETRFRLSGRDAPQEELISLLGEYAGKRMNAEAFASPRREEVLRFLQRKGVAMDIPEVRKDVILVGFMDVVCKWFHEGEAVSIETDTPAGSVSAVRLKETIHRKLNVEDHPHVVTQIYMADDDFRVYLTLPGRNVDNALSLAAETSRLSALIRQKRCRDNFEWGDLIFPAVDMRTRNVLGGLSGLRLSERLTLAYAVEDNTLKLGKFGAKVASTFLGARCHFAMPKEPYVIHQPFLIWGEVNSLIYYSAYVHWKSWL